MAQDKTETLFPETVASSRLLLKREFAELMGVTAGRISQLVHRGLPLEPNGLIDPEKGKAWWAENLMSGRKRLAGVQPTLASTKAAIDAERLEQLRLETARQRGELVERAVVRRAIADRGRAERDAHMSWVMRTAPVLAAELGVDGNRMYSALDGAMREHLQFLARTPLEELLNDG